MPEAFARRFEAIVFDWHGTAASDRQADVTVFRRLVEEASTLGLELAVVSGTHVGGRSATAEEDAALSRCAALIVERLAAQGLAARIVSERLNWRKIDLIPEPEWEDPPKTRSDERLIAVEDRLARAGIAGLSEAVGIARAAAADAGLSDPKVIGDVNHVEIGLTDRSDSSQWLMGWLWQRGIAPEQALIIGDECAPETFAAVLEDQIARRRLGELPIVAERAGWTLAIDGVDPVREGVHESLLTLGDGRLGTRGSVLAGHASELATVVMSGVYTRTGAETHLLAAPRWNTISVRDCSPRSVRRVLDLHAGVLQQQLQSESGRIDALLLSSLARPSTAALRVRDRSESMHLSRSLAAPSGPTYEEGQIDGSAWMRVRGRPGSIVTAAHDQLRGTASDRVLDRIAAYEGVARGEADESVARDRLRLAQGVGFDGLLVEHRRAWASRWEDADMRIDGDPQLQLAVRLAIFHLMASVSDGGEAAVGARGLTGSAYRGHVFWDTDVYVMPMLAATHPQAARAILEYRLRRMPAAIRAARAHGRAGARFPWESAQSGQDVTPKSGRDRRGDLIPILTGELEEHIVADVAWAAACYIDWTGDQSFAAGAGRELIVQTARWWASRIEVDEHARGHIRGVIGPDEYHENVDDNAYTNVMARWNLRRASHIGAELVQDSERRRWLELADAIVDGYDPTTGIYEQFSGFHALEPLLVSELAPQLPVSADTLLGHERLRTTQLVKQADVLMLHYLVPDEVAAGSLEPNLDFYGPRAAHGSTLSPGAHAALLARAGRLAESLEMLRLAARIDFDDIGHSTAGGMHLAAMGSVWRTLAFGFAGLRPVGDALAIDPVIAPGWKALELRVRFRGSRVRVRIDADTVEVSAHPPANALSPAGERVILTEKVRSFELSLPAPSRPEG
jgi:trehalose/maltose hydrolase-like predicted phosphorylase